MQLFLVDQPQNAHQPSMQCVRVKMQFSILYLSPWYIPMCGGYSALIINWAHHPHNDMPKVGAVEMLLLADTEQLIRTEGKLEKTKYTLAPSENLLQSNRSETCSWHLIIQSIHPSLRSPSQRTSIFGEVWGCGCFFKALTPDPEFSRVGVGEAAVCTAYLACQIRAGPRGRSILIFSHACRIPMSPPPKLCHWIPSSISLALVCFTACRVSFHIPFF